MFLKKFDKRNISGLQSPSRKKQKIVAVFPDDDVERAELKKENVTDVPGDQGAQKICDPSHQLLKLGTNWTL